MVSEPLMAAKAKWRRHPCFTFAAANDSEGDGEGLLYAGAQEPEKLSALPPPQNAISNRMHLRHPKVVEQTIANVCNCNWGGSCPHRDSCSSRDIVCHNMEKDNIQITIDCSKFSVTIPRSKKYSSQFPIRR